MRLTSFMVYNQIKRSLQRNMEDYARLHNQLATGKKIDKPSDDVTGTIKAMDYKLNISNNDQFTANITNLKAGFDFVDKIFSSSVSALEEIKRIAGDGATGTQTAELRDISAQGIAQFRDQLLSLANSKFNDRYIFSGFKTDTKAFDPATFLYQGDSGIVNAAIGTDLSVAANFTGSNTFGFAMSAPETVRLIDGNYAHYTPGAGTTVNVEIRASDDVTVLDTFSYDNIIQAADIISSALQANNIPRVEALLKPLADATNHILNVQSELGMRERIMEDQRNRLSLNNLSLKNTLALTEDADITETIIEINKTDVALQALRTSSKQVLSQSLMDFLG